MQIKNHIQLSLQSLSDNVGVARMAAATFSAQAEFTLSEIDEIKVAISEAISNSIIHGYGDSDGIVTFTMNLYENSLEYIIADNGVGIADVAAARQPSYSTDPERMGLGFAFMESFMDILEVSSTPGKGTIVRMVKNFSLSSAKQVS